MTEAPPHNGLATDDRAGVRERLEACWGAFVATAESLDLERPSRLPGWSAHDLCVHLGTWGDAQALGSLLSSARTGGGKAPDTDRANAALIKANAAASRDDVLAALRRSAEGTATFLESAEAEELALAPTVSILGTLPLMTIMNAGCYELAVHLLDLVPAGAAKPETTLLLDALGALLDSTAALAVRQGITIGLTGQTPDGGWRVDTTPGGWTTTRVPPGPVDGCAILGDVAQILDVSAGRISAPPLVAARKLRVQEMRTLLRLTPLVEEVPGLPGGAPLRAAAKTFGAAAGLLGRLPHFGRRG